MTMAVAFSADLTLSTADVSFSTKTFLEGQSVRIYATAHSASNIDLRGVIRFFDNDAQIQGDQPISVVSSQTDTVFVDWTPTPGVHTIKIKVVPFEEGYDDPANNSIETQITVFADTDRDGIANSSDGDDDNDGIPDADDTFPLNKNESLDSDGDGIGNNADEDDDNDDVLDTDDAFPLNANEALDSDNDGIGNNADTDDDGDNISDMEELKHGTDPLLADTDGDGAKDNEDVEPLDKNQTRDFDKDGVSDERDEDADNDGIAKNDDINDTNLGPDIVITTSGKSPRRLLAVNEKVSYETTNSEDPDGKITNTEWMLPGGISHGENMQTSFSGIGFYKILAKVTDDKGEYRTKYLTVLVLPRYASMVGLGVLLLLVALAIFFFFSYSGRRHYENRHPPKILRTR